jgi:hypothetical protein
MSFLMELKRDWLVYLFMFLILLGPVVELSIAIGDPEGYREMCERRRTSMCYHHRPYCHMCGAPLYDQCLVNPICFNNPTRKW